MITIENLNIRLSERIPQAKPQKKGLSFDALFFMLII